MIQSRIPQDRPPAYLNLVVEELTARNADLEHGYALTREMLRISLAQQHRAYQQIRRLEDTRDTLIDELRRMRRSLAVTASETPNTTDSEPVPDLMPSPPSSLGKIPSDVPRVQ